MPKVKYLYLVFWVIWLILVTYLSLATFDDFGANIQLFKLPYFDKIVHFIFYTVMSFLSILTLNDFFVNKFGLAKVILAGVAFSVLYGMVIELLQGTQWISRDMDYLDALANSMGALFGAYVAYRVILAKRKI